MVHDNNMKNKMEKQAVFKHQKTMKMFVYVYNTVLLVLGISKEVLNTLCKFSRVVFGVRCNSVLVVFGVRCNSVFYKFPG